MLKIAFVGRLSSGQKEAAIYLKKKYNFKRMKFDDGVRRVILLLYSIPHFKKTGPYQKLAVYDALYKTDPDIWFRYLEARLTRVTNNVVIEDARYTNEVLRLKELGFIIVRLSRPRLRYLTIRSPKTASPNTVALIEAFDKNAADRLSVDYSILNDSKEALYRGLDEIIQKYLTNEVASSNILLGTDVPINIRE